jgi:DNA-binding SARP family transcriptional activator
VLRIRLLGEMTVEGREGPIELSGSWRARTLMAWLALKPGSHLRSDLAPRFWPDVTDESARASLRNGLWAVRKALGPESGALNATRDRVGLAGGEMVWVDLHEFRALREAGKPEDALALVRGDLLEGMEEEWVYDARDEQRDELSALLQELAAAADERGDGSGAIGLTRRRVAIDPLAEEPQRELISRLAKSGDRSGALGAYERVRERYRSELGISPSEQTRELARQIRDGELDASVPPDSVAVPAPVTTAGSWAPGAPFPLPTRIARAAEGPLHGREEELERLRDEWRSVAAGHGPRLVLVSGEAGMGKSALAAALAAEVQGAGAVVLHGSAEAELLIPHQALAAALGHLASESSPEALATLVGSRASDLEPLLPRLAPDNKPAEDPSGGRRYRLFEGVADLLGDLSQTAPVLLLIDDLQWVDQSTAAIVRHALETRPDLRLLVLATRRPSVVPTGSGAAETLQRLAQADFVTPLDLEGLSHEATKAVASSAAGTDLPAGLVTAIHEQAAGNPFFAAELARDLGEDRGVRDLTAAQVPGRIREVLDLRLGRLSEACLRLLSVAAVIGTEFELEPLERVSDLEGDDLAAALDEATAAGLVVELSGEEHEAFAFAHELIRRTLLDRLSRARRRRVHARVAEALDNVHGDGALLEVAHHLCEARPVSDRDEALDYATRAAQRATEDLAYAEAVDLFTRARSLLPEDDPRRRRLALKRAIAYQALFHAVMDAPPAGEAGEPA